MLRVRVFRDAGPEIREDCIRPLYNHIPHVVIVHVYNLVKISNEKTMLSLRLPGQISFEEVK
jgi:hypothetical protein